MRRWHRVAREQGGQGGRAGGRGGPAVVRRRGGRRLRRGAPREDESGGFCASRPAQRRPVERRRRRRVRKRRRPLATTRAMQSLFARRRRPPAPGRPPRAVWLGGRAAVDRQRRHLAARHSVRRRRRAAMPGSTPEKVVARERVDRDDESRSAGANSHSPRSTCFLCAFLPRTVLPGSTFVLLSTSSTGVALPSSSGTTTRGLRCASRTLVLYRSSLPVSSSSAITPSGSSPCADAQPDEPRSARRASSDCFAKLLRASRSPRTISLPDLELPLRRARAVDWILEVRGGKCRSLADVAPSVAYVSLAAGARELLAAPGGGGWLIFPTTFFSSVNDPSGLV